MSSIQIQDMEMFYMKTNISGISYNSYSRYIYRPCFVKLYIYLLCCSGDSWDDNGAKVVCRELGFNPEYEFSKADGNVPTWENTRSDNFTLGGMDIHWREGAYIANCDGSEQKLSECITRIRPSSREEKEKVCSSSARVICHSKIVIILGILFVLYCRRSITTVTD